MGERYGRPVSSRSSFNGGGSGGGAVLRGRRGEQGRRWRVAGRAVAGKVLGAGEVGGRASSARSVRVHRGGVAVSCSAARGGTGEQGGAVAWRRAARRVHGGEVRTREASVAHRATRTKYILLHTNCLIKQSLHELKLV